MIGDDVEITVLSVQGDKVRLGVQAPSKIPIFRTEIYVEIVRERERDTGADAGSDAEELSSRRDPSDE